ncbi:MAG: hypothetical protein K6C69_04105 [Lachnospiraceae bacterium]|nr:hypothetical protein [Lachnospiraceae bacterium]
MTEAEQARLEAEEAARIAEIEAEIKALEALKVVYENAKSEIEGVKSETEGNQERSNALIQQLESFDEKINRNHFFKGIIAEDVSQYFCTLTDEVVEMRASINGMVCSLIGQSSVISQKIQLINFKIADLRSQL